MMNDNSEPRRRPLSYRSQDTHPRSQDSAAPKTRVAPKPTKSNMPMIPLGDVDPLLGGNNSHVAQAYNDPTVMAPVRRGGRRPGAANGTSRQNMQLIITAVLGTIVAISLLGSAAYVLFISPNATLAKGKGESSALAKSQNEDMRALLQDLQSKLKSDQHTGDVIKDMELKLEAALTENTEMAKKLVQAEGQKSVGLRGGTEGLDVLKKRIERLEDESLKLKGGIQLLSKRRIIEKWGEGPHRFELLVHFHEEQADPNGRIVIELAPINEMPHTTYWFLEQVEAKLYDGCSFHRNADHIIQAGPNMMDNSSPDRHRFIEAQLDHVLFSEYSYAFPHVKYTIGYAGRPSGPDFYVNMIDNTVLHGPGGQHAVNDNVEADHAEPCFAKVVEGFEVAERIHKAPVRDDLEMIARVDIASIRLIR